MRKNKPITFRVDSKIHKKINERIKDLEFASRSEYVRTIVENDVGDE